MATNYKPYPEYKDSGIEWLGKIPPHWQAKRLKYGFQLLTEKAVEKENPVGLENIEGWSGRFFETDSEFQGDGVAFQKGDILFGKLRPYLAKVYLADFSGEAVGDFHVMRPMENVTGQYALYQCLNKDFINTVDSSTYGAKMPRVSWEYMANMLFAFPPQNEQWQIAAFLNHETAKIDTLIDKQQQLIKLLKEKRQAVISHAVTKGLNPDVPMKDSGVEWLGEVPEHWTVIQLRRIISNMEQGKSPECESREADIDEWGVLKTSCVNHSIYNSQANKALPKNIEPFPQYEVKQADLLMSRASGSIDLIGSVAYVHETRSKILLSDKVFRIHLSGVMNGVFFSFLMRSSYMRLNIKQAISGAEGMANNITKTAIIGFNFALPPLIEQNEIIAYLTKKLDLLNILIKKANSQIGLLQERRAALISAAVTGKIDVRGWQAEQRPSPQPLSQR